MSGRLLVVVLILAVLSAAVGAGAAFLLQRSDDAPPDAAEVAVVVTVDSATDDTTDTPDAPDPQEPPQADAEATDAAHSLSTSTESTQEPTPPSAAAQAEAEQPQASQTSATPPSATPQSLEQADPESAQPEVETVETPQPDEDARPLATLKPNVITQGEAVAVTVESQTATAVAATINARSWNLSEVSPGVWWTVIAIPRDADTGATEAVIDLYGEGGAWMRSISASFIVLASAAPFEEIILGGTGEPIDPAEVERDISVRFVEHSAVTGPPHWEGAWQLPVEGEVSGVFGSFRSYDGVPSDGWHHGHDIAAQHGDPIVAPAPGVVVWAGELAIHGIGVILDHGAGVYSGYWHMSLFTVREGMQVAAGDWLGNIGSTGLSTGPHLHWEVIVQGVDVDPIQWTGDDQPPLPAPTAAQDATESTDTLAE